MGTLVASNKCPRCRQNKPGYKPGVRTCLGCSNYEKRFKKSPIGKLTYNKAKAKWRTSEHGKELVEAHRAVRNALRNGLLTRTPCEVCDAQEVQGHHESYREEDRLKVRWLCALHHKEEHSVSLG